jgi:hypothetical protein
MTHQSCCLIDREHAACLGASAASPHQHHNPLTMLHVSLPAAGQARLTLSAFPVAGDDSSAAGGASAALRALRGTQIATNSTRSIMRTGQLAPAAALEGFGALTSLECSLAAFGRRPAPRVPPDGAATAGVGMQMHDW